MIPPDADDLKACREAWQLGRKLAEKNNLLVAGGWGVGGDALAWFCGLQNAVLMAIEDPEFFASVIKSISDWNKPRMEAYLDFGIDLYIRRAWYEGTDFWSPDLFRQFFLPVIKEEVQLAHEAGTKYGYILTSGSMAIHDQLIEAGIDVLIGADPVQGKGTDLKKMKKDFSDKVCLWGGVNGFVTVETGTEKEIEKAVKTAIESCGPTGLILSPVDNISDPSDEVWNKMLHLIKAWKKYT
jgi:uroporphyrinogen-III decarboxylase